MSLQQLNNIFEERLLTVLDKQQTIITNTLHDIKMNQNNGDTNNT